MSIPCECMSGDDLLKEIRVGFSFPYDFMSGVTYEFKSDYDEVVTVKCTDYAGNVWAEDVLKFKHGLPVYFGQFHVFLKQFIVLPNYFSLILHVSEKEVISAEVKIFPLKM